MGRSGLSVEKRKVLGRLVADNRRLLGWKPEELAARAGYSVSSIHSFEVGRRGGRDTYLAIARALNAGLALQRMDLLPLDDSPETHHWLTPALTPLVGDLPGPASLLEARLGIVPWQGKTRARQLEELATWCDSPGKIRSFSIKGDGGMGKTRLAVALCQHLNQSRKWVTGFILPRRFPVAPDWWNSLPLDGRPLLMVADYTSRPGMIEVLNRVLPALDKLQSHRIRILLLDRTGLQQGLLDGDAWRVWDQIRTGHLPHFGPQLEPVSVDPEERLTMFQGAARAFACHLAVKPFHPESHSLKSPASKAYNQVLLLHMQALERVFDAAPKSDNRNSILNRLLDRERQHWRETMRRLELPQHLISAVEAAVVGVSELGGMPSATEAAAKLGGLPEFQGLPRATTDAVVRLLRDIYPDGDKGIAPLRPDPLFDHLANERLRTCT